jgi:uncharacterized protein
MLKLHSVDRNGKVRSFDYDPHIPRLMDNGIAFKPFREMPPFYDESKIREVRIAMGTACNMRCAYCCQQHGAKQACSQDALGALIADLREVLEARGDGHIAVSFWGGEPLAYFEVIKFLTEAFAQQGPQGREIHFGIASNGNLITPQITDFLIGHNFSFTLSHDGPGQHIRGLDPWADEGRRTCLQRLYKELHAFNFSCVMTDANNSYQALLQHLQEMTGDEQVQILEARPLVPHFEQGLAHMPDKEDLQKHTVDLLSCLLAGWGRNYRVFADKVRSFMVHLSGNLPMDAGPCFSDKFSTLITDLEGNMLSCQNFLARDITPLGDSHGYGRIRDLLDVNLFPAPARFLSWHNRQDCNCKNCPVLHFCRGGCPYNDPAWHEAECRSKYAHFLALLAYSLFEISGCLLTHIEGDFKFRDTNELNLLNLQAEVN